MSGNVGTGQRECGVAARMLHGISHPLHSASHHRSVQRPSRGKPASSTTHTPFLQHHCRPLQVKPFPASKSSKSCVRIAATFVPAINPDDPQLTLPAPSPPTSPAPPPNLNPALNGSLNSSRAQEWRVYANNNSKNGRWPKDDESALNKDEPLPLPMVYPGSTPNPLDVEKMKNCDPVKQDCKDVFYQWTGKCSRCQGTGEVSFFRKKGREVICKCIPCMGLGYVHKMTLRTNIEVSDDVDGTP